MIIIGIDPDSEKHGVALYVHGQLKELLMKNRIEIMAELKKDYGMRVIVSIENNLINNFVYGKNANKNKKIEGEILRKVGRVQQAQIELMRDLDQIGTAYVLHKPTSRNWKKNTELFKRTTGWTGRSNDDTRSAAYFGWLQLKTMGA